MNVDKIQRWDEGKGEMVDYVKEYHWDEKLHTACKDSKRYGWLMWIGGFLCGLALGLSTAQACEGPHNGMFITASIGENVQIFTDEEWTGDLPAGLTIGHRWNWLDRTDVDLLFNHRSNWGSGCPRDCEEWESSAEFLELRVWVWLD